MRSQRSILLPLLLVAALAAVGCKKKEKAGDAVPKPAEGSAAVVTGSGSAPTEPVAAGGTADVVKPPAETKTIIDVAKQAGTFTTLLKAIDAAGLTERLAGPGPFTVLAPTDEAFAKLPPKDLDALLADKAKLEAVLQYHVVTGAVASTDIATQKTIKTLQGGELTVDAASGVKIGGATVVTPDIAAANGVIHAIDTVLLPK